MRKLDALKLDQSHQEDLRKLGVKSLNFFGSVARDQANSQSDVDILVELVSAIPWRQMAGLSS